MRVFVFVSLLLASTTLASRNERPKRHLAYLKNLINSAIFGRSQINIQPQTVVKEENGYKLFRLPGYDDVMIKVTPKKPVIEEFVYPTAVKPVNLNAFGSVVGTKTKEDTLVAVKEVDNLLSTGILYGGQNNVMKETVTPMFPSLSKVNYVVEEKIKTAPVIQTRPVLTEVIESKPILKEVIESKPILKEVIKTKPVLKEVIETKPVLTEVIRPLKERVELEVPFEPIYSYTQMQNNEPMLTYTGHTIPGVEVLETLKMKSELPMCIKKRIDEAIVLAADPNRLAPEQEIFQYQSPPVDFTYPRVEATSFVQSAEPNRFAPVQEVYQYQTAPVVDFSYPRIEANSYLQNPERERVFVKGIETVSDFVLSPQRLRPLKDSPVHYNLRPTKVQEIHPRPIPLYKHKSLPIEKNISASKDKANSRIKKVQAFNYLGKKVDIAQTLGPIPSQYMTHQANKSGNEAVTNEKIMKQMKAVPIVGSKDNVVNAKIPIKVYKTQSNTNTVKVVKESDALRTNTESNFNQYVATHVLTPKRVSEVKNGVFTNKVIAKPPSVTSPIVVASTNPPKLPLRENIQTSFKSTPVVVKDNKGYIYQQKNANGSSLNVKGDKHGVSVNIENNNNRGRGDIPDQ